MRRVHRVTKRLGQPRSSQPDPLYKPGPVTMNPLAITRVVTDRIRAKVAGPDLLLLHHHFQKDAGQLRYYARQIGPRIALGNQGAGAAAVVNPVGPVET